MERCRKVTSPTGTDFTPLQSVTILQNIHVLHCLMPGSYLVDSGSSLCKSAKYEI
jgi:hypothetical protein